MIRSNFAPGAVVAQQLEHVIADELRFVQIQLVELDVLPGDIQRRLRGIHADHLRAAAHQSGNGEGAGVGEAVQHPTAGGVIARRRAAVALVEVETGLVPLLNIHQQLHAVFGDRQQFRRQIAQHRALRQRQAFFLRTATSERS